MMARGQNNSWAPLPTKELEILPNLNRGFNALDMGYRCCGNLIAIN